MAYVARVRRVPRVWQCQVTETGHLVTTRSPNHFKVERIPFLDISADSERINEKMVPPTESGIIPSQRQSVSPPELDLGKRTRKRTSRRPPFQRVPISLNVK